MKFFCNFISSNSSKYIINNHNFQIIKTIKTHLSFIQAERCHNHNNKKALIKEEIHTL